MRPRRTVVIAARLGLLIGPLLAQPIASAAQEAEPTMTLEERIDAVFSDYDTTRSPGCSLGVVRDGDLTLAATGCSPRSSSGPPVTLSESTPRRGSSLRSP